METSTTSMDLQTSPTETQEDEGRFSRQAAFIPRERIVLSPVTVIGVGAIGRQVALQLAAIGVPALQLIDFDIVEDSNRTTQMYNLRDIGMSKVRATAEAIRAIDPEIVVSMVNDRWRPDTVVHNHIFCCVDSIETRGLIFKELRDSVDFWTDGRMLGEVIRVISANSPETFQHYQTTLFSAAEAQQGGCTTKATVYTAAGAAVLMVNQFRRHLSRTPVMHDILYDLFAMDTTVLPLAAKS